jgi:hypothetical protein
MARKRKQAAAKDALAGLWPTPRPEKSVALLKALHILTREGSLNADSRRKLKQVLHLTQILRPALEALLEDSQEPVLADLGAGKSYLGFVLYDLILGPAGRGRVVGVDTRADLTEASRVLAMESGFERMEFVCSPIEEAVLPGSRADMVTALHACDTATDDAIRRGIELGAKLIVVAPCCHKEIRPQLSKPEPLAPVLRHGLMEERMAEWLTDGLRALFLEWAGYRTKVFEFVASEHTPKNLMIAAVRAGEPFTDASAKKQIEDLKAFFNVKQHALDPLLVAADVRRL